MYIYKESDWVGLKLGHCAFVSCLCLGVVLANTVLCPCVRNWNPAFVEIETEYALGTQACSPS